MNELTERIDILLCRQIREWELVRQNYSVLANTKTRWLYIGDFPVMLQFNPERIRSSAAKTDAVSLQQRPCFFCNPPDMQDSITYNDFDILINPYPIFQGHLTIPLRWHEEQNILPYFEDMLYLAHDLMDYVVFYNGPKCGASAPDHMHFQAIPSGHLPIESSCLRADRRHIWTGDRTTLYALDNFMSSMFLLISSDRKEALLLLRYLYLQLDKKEGESEPMMNVAMWKDDDNKWIICIFPRKELRPSCFYAKGDDNILISPATVEMAGLFITPLEKDFEKVTGADLATILKEVSVSEEDMDRIISKFLKNL